MRITLLGLATAALVGCGGGGGGTFTTSVPAGAKLTSLTSAQATQLCTDLTNYEMATLAPDLCKVLGLTAAETAAATATALKGAAPTDASLQAACTQASNSCLSGDGGPNGSFSSSCSSNSFASEPSTCPATVGDLQTCATDETAAFNQVYGSLPSCSSLTAASLASAYARFSTDGGSGPSEPASCSKFDAQCKGMSMSSGGTN